MSFYFQLGFLLFISLGYSAKSQCSKGCSLALGSYYVWPETNLTFTAEVSNTQINDILSYNKEEIPNKDSVQSDIRIEIPFSCDCINREFLGHVFTYNVRSGDTYETIANKYYANLTTAAWIQRFNSYDPNNIPDTNAVVNVTVNCSCGDSKVSKDYGLFVTYPLRPGDTLQTVVTRANFSAGAGVNGSDLLQRYNPNANFSAGTGRVYVPGKDENGTFPPLKSSKGGLSSGGIAGIVVAVIVGLLLLVGYFGFYRRKQATKIRLSTAVEDHSTHAPGSTLLKGEESSVVASPRLTGITVDKSVEFTYEELSKATNEFNITYKIGQGGFGAVYYAELRGEKAAIKKMDMQASREFLAELKVLTHVHHLNLVRLIGYCVEGSLFLVYEFIENGNLSEHLRGSGRPLLSWSTRVQIALDSARGLEYIHEHTVPVYIHRDIKSANILIDKNFRGKVADFGLTKLTEVGSTSLPTRLVGTFGYMPPEYAQYGDVSPKVDVYAFGVVLYELISAKEAIVKGNDSASESKGLVGMYGDVSPKVDVYAFGVVLYELISAKEAIVKGNDSASESKGLVGMVFRYAQYGDVSPKVDVYAFGVVLYELISAKEAIVKGNDSASESKGLVGMFEEVFNKPDPIESFEKLIDPKLGDDYPIDSVQKLAQLAKACTQENPQLRPSMRSIVVALMTLSSSTGDWDIGSFYENHDIVNLMSGR